MTNKEAIELLDDLRKYEHSEYYEQEVQEALEKGIKALENQKVGHWIDCADKDLWYRCSECGKRMWSGNCYNYCPDCGAKMKGEQE